jgi:hypothetical protein
MENFLPLKQTPAPEQDQIPTPAGTSGPAGGTMALIKGPGGFSPLPSFFPAFWHAFSTNMLIFQQKSYASL